MPQVSIDSLWSLQKRREKGAGATGGGSSVFDQDSLLALPLGLRLKYASLTENQREQIARRYAQQEPPASHGPPTGGSSAQDESRARRLASSAFAASAAAAATAAAAAAAAAPPAALAGVDDGGLAGVGGVSFSPPSRPQEPRPPSSLPILLDVELQDGGEKATPPSGGGRERPPVLTPALSSPRSAELHRLSLSQVDHDVLDCLPPEVRDEVLRSIASNAAGEGRGQGEARGGDAAASGVGRDHGSGRNERHLTNDPDPRYEKTNANNADESPETDGGAGIVAEDVVDVCSPSFSSPEREGRMGAGGRGGRNRVKGGVFDFEPAGALRGVLRKWVGGAVRSPSQWHLELLYRYLEELVEAGRLDETATLLRCLGRLSSKADKCAAGIGDDASSAAGSVGEDAAGWVTGYRAVLAAVQELVRERTGGASLALVC